MGDGVGDAGIEVTVRVGVGVADGVGVKDLVADDVGDWVVESVGVGDGVKVADGDGVSVGEAVRVAVTCTELVEVAEGDHVGVSVEVTVLDGDPEGVGDPLEGVNVFVAAGGGPAVSVAVGDGEVESVAPAGGWVGEEDFLQPMGIIPNNRVAQTRRVGAFRMGAPRHSGWMGLYQQFSTEIRALSPRRWWIATQP